MDVGSPVWFDLTRWTGERGNRRCKIAKQAPAKFPWWPAVIEEYAGGLWKVKLFASPSVAEVHTANIYLLEKLRSQNFHAYKNAGVNSNYKNQFRHALDLCIEAESQAVDDDDAELPSFQNIKIAASTPVKENCKTESTVEVNNIDSSSPSGSPETDGFAFTSPAKKRRIDLKPLEKGMHVLAFYIGDRKYHPAVVLERKAGQKDLYKIEYWDLQTNTISRNRIVSSEDEHFGMQSISPECYHYLNNMFTVFPNQADLQSALEYHLSKVRDIYHGRLDIFGRYKNFMKGGKARSDLAQRVHQGPFSKAEREFVMSWLKSQLEREKSSEDSQYEHVDLVANVVFPETLNLLIRKRNSIDAETAEQTLATDRCDNWVSTLTDNFENRQKTLLKTANN